MARPSERLASLLRPQLDLGLECSVANTKSAEKQNRQAIKHRARNARITSTLRTQVRKAREAIEKGDAATTKTELHQAIRQIAKAASKGVIHQSQADRRIARLSKAAHKLGASK
jgi:small subunit ribosomal protein S20